MKKAIKSISAALGCIATVACVGFGLSGCVFFRSASERLRDLEETLSYLVLGGDAFSQNVFMVDGEGSFGIPRAEDVSWTGYSKISSKDIKQVRNLYKLLKNQLKGIKVSDLTAEEAVTYRTMDSMLSSQYEYFSSEYAADFMLIGRTYISAEGGDVAEFASTCENYTFRSEADVKDLIAMTVSTETAFPTYINYVQDRADAGYPLYDYTVEEMISYLNSITAYSDEYYLYDFMDGKIDAADFLTDAKRARYKREFSDALTENFMSGVRALANGLEKYADSAPETEYSYLGAYGEAGKAYYEWNFYNKTGIKDAKMLDVYNDLAEYAVENNNAAQAVIDYVDSRQITDPELYEEFNAYKNGDKVYFDMTEPESILQYLEGVAENIVPALDSKPDIDFKMMDSTVAERSNTLAYYLMSPWDERNASEHITLNPYQMEQDPSLALTTIAHEGYPGHLYAHVRAKESGVSLLTGAVRCLSFMEGWSQYVETEVLDYIASSADSEALRLYSLYDKYTIAAGYASSALYDMQINYFGVSLEDFAKPSGDAENAEEVKTRLERAYKTIMEMPTAYIPYGYGMYVLVSLHDNAKVALGSDYDVVEFNDLLLSEGMGPTLVRAREITDNYIKSKKGE